MDHATHRQSCAAIACSLADGVLENHQQPHKWRFRNLDARTAASCWSACARTVAMNLTSGLPVRWELRRHVVIERGIT